MKISQINVSAVIPTGQYANVQPTITVDLDETDNIDLAKAMALDQIESVSAMYAISDGKALKRKQSNPHQGEEAKVLTDFITGETINFYPGAHAYMDDEGFEYLSGSKYAHQYTPEFDKANILPRYAAKHGVEEDAIEELWSDKGEASTTFGTAVHKALEVFGRSYTLQKTLGKDPIECIHPYLRPIVKAFYTPARIKLLERGKMVWEASVLDKTLKRCGQLDLVTIVDEKNKILDIEDYKTNVDIYKKNDGKLKPPFAALPNIPVAAYTLQLSFYKDIVEAHGWTVRKLKLHHLNDKNEWDEVILSPVNTVKTRLKLEHV